VPGADLEGRVGAKSGSLGDASLKFKKKILIFKKNTEPEI